MSKELGKNTIRKELEDELRDLKDIDLERLFSYVVKSEIKVFEREETTKTDIIDYFLTKDSNFESFFIIDIGKIIERVKLWYTYLPNIEPFYAVKCNPDPVILEALSSLGIGFDVASKEEVQLVSSLADKDSVIFANPVKSNTDITFYEYRNMDMMTFDCIEELKKIAPLHPYSRLVLRLLVDDSQSDIPLGEKFGCPKGDVEEIFKLAKSLGMQIIGVSFHVGSNCKSSGAYSRALRDAREVFDLAKSHGFDMTLLDIGGGFPGNNDVSFISMAEEIEKGITELFNEPNIRIIAEPGRFFVTECGTLVMNVILNKYVKQKEIYHIHVNSSIYGMLNNAVFDDAQLCLKTLKTMGPNEPLYDCMIFGQTCDARDRIQKPVKLPKLINCHWLYLENHGAYTIAAASTFNGFKLPQIKYVCII